MDKLKPIIAAVAKHLFWVGCGLILVVSVLTWYMARGRLHTEFGTNLSEIESKVQNVGSLMEKSEQNPPNQHSHEGMDKLLDGTLKLVLEAWRKQYSYQENLLRWPPALGDDFIADVRPLKPIEVKVEYPTPASQRLKVDFRQRYGNYVENLLPRLAKLVGTTWAPQRGAASGPEGMTMGMDRKANGPAEPLVVWEAQDQSRLLATHFNWSGQQDSAPTTLQLLYAQEDLWVLEALVRIIAETNQGAKSRHDAVVKTIESIMIGRGVTGRAGQVMRIGSGQMGGGPMAMEGGDFSSFGESGYDASPGGEGGAGYSPYEGGGEESSEGMEDSSDGGMDESGSPGGSSYAGAMGTSGSGTTQLTADPADGRYVDNDYVPLRATRIREAMTSNDPKDAFLVVAKRMPIRLRLVVDQRKLHRLLANCGNSGLPVEIRQVRINRGQSSSGTFGGTGGGMGVMPGEGALGGALGLGGYGSMMGNAMEGQQEGQDSSMYGAGGNSPEGMGPEGMGPSSFMPSAESGGTRVQVSSTTSHDVPVELYGIIYIYNPVDEKRLGIEPSQEGGLTGPVQPETNAPG